MPDLDPETVRQAMADAIESALPGHLVTRWYVAVETVNAETGERAMWTQSPEDQTAWDTLGLIEFCKVLENAAELRYRIQQQGDDD